MREEPKYNFAEKTVIYVIATIVGIVVVALALFISSWICLAIDMSDSYSSLISGVCLGIGAMTSGFLSAKKIKTGGIINGGICGLIMYLMVFVLSLFISDNGFSTVTVSHSLIAIISAAIGGILGVNTSTRRKII